MGEFPTLGEWKDIVVATILTYSLMVVMFSAISIAIALWEFCDYYTPCLLVGSVIGFMIFLAGFYLTKFTVENRRKTLRIILWAFLVGVIPFALLLKIHHIDTGVAVIYGMFLIASPFHIIGLKDTSNNDNVGGDG